MLDYFGDRMKGYEVVAEGARLDVSLPIYARIDGRSFSKFTRDFERPFDDRMSSAMIDTMKELVDKTHARLGYTQSDEINLVFLSDNPESDTIFNGRPQKLVSVLASLATALFHDAILQPWKDRLPHFDCRVCQLPSKAEAANMFLWRWKDATKNAISMVAQENFSPRTTSRKTRRRDDRNAARERDRVWMNFRLSSGAEHLRVAYLSCGN